MLVISAILKLLERLLSELYTTRSQLLGRIGRNKRIENFTSDSVLFWCCPNLRSYPPSLYSEAGKKGMIHLLDGSYVQKPDSVFFSDWSKNHTSESLRSYWSLYFNKTSGEKVGQKSKWRIRSDVLARTSFPLP